VLLVSIRACSDNPQVLQVNTENTENTDIESDEPESPAEKDPKPSPEPSAESSPENSPENSPELAPEPAREEAEPPRRSGGAIQVLAFLFSLLALVGTGWMWWLSQGSAEQEQDLVFTEISRLESSDQELGLELQQIRDELSKIASGDIGAEFRAMQDRLEADRRKLAAAEASINEQLELSRSLQAAAGSMQGRLAAAEAAVSGLSTRELDVADELDIAEVDYLLRLANERLKLFLDPVAADQTLEVADMHLAALDNPIYLGVRQDIAAARRSLAAIDMPDYLQIANDLDAVQEKIAVLPFRGDDPPASAGQQAQPDGWWEKLKGVFSGLVTVRRSTDDENQRISLQDKDYVRQRVWLQLEIAHLSLMRRDQEGFRKALTRVDQSLSDWFDHQDSQYQAIMQSVKNLQGMDIQVEIPDITAPWSNLRTLRSNLSQPAAAIEPIQE
ncbi:MAG: uroporphyrinogen-III C-methyltransferase, partial [Xanthomonadales bacterium]|nr:uroporphyrinogen-III C-methyltransferase [Xanthomonadales bacterium]